jgi:probable HAF family extracellular repeat protein
MANSRLDRAYVRVGAAVVLSFVGRAEARPVFQGLGFLPGGTASEAAGISADGTVVVGTNLSPSIRAFLWTAATGMVDLGVLPGQTESYAAAVSADGQVVVGWSQNPDQSRPFRWTAAGGMVGLNVPVGYRAYAVSGDGSLIAGDTDPGTALAFRWTAAAGLELLPRLLCAEDHARFVTPDGSRIVGWSAGAARPACTGAVGTQAAVWPASGGVIGVGPGPGGASSMALAASADGAVLVGTTTSNTSTSAGRWTTETGWVALVWVGACLGGLGGRVGGRWHGAAPVLPRFQGLHLGCCARGVRVWLPRGAAQGVPPAGAAGRGPGHLVGRAHHRGERSQRGEPAGGVDRGSDDPSAIGLLRQLRWEHDPAGVECQ